MATVQPKRATLDDLMRTEGKAELIGGRVVEFMASGRIPSRIAFRIARFIDGYAEEAGQGEAFADGVGYAVRELSSGRESFQPDASYYLGPEKATMKFIPAPPTFAVEVRSEGDYGPAAEVDIAAKRADYFEAGTAVVWDVDCDAREIRAYRHDAPENPVVFRLGDEAHAEPALPGWRASVDRIFA